MPHIPRSLERFVLHPYWRFSRGVTLGARGVVTNAEGSVFLIKHSYMAGWHFPGGGVEKGETTQDALVRELDEEGSIIVEGALSVHGVFAQRSFRNDHVVLYRVGQWSQPVWPTPNREVVEHGFFPPDALPDGVSPATQRRIAELFFGEPVSAWW